MGKRMLGQLAHLHNVVGSLKLISTTILETKMCRYAREGGGGGREVCVLGCAYVCVNLPVCLPRGWQSR